MFSELNQYDVNALCFSEHLVEITKTKFLVSCYLGKFDLAKQMRDEIDFELKEQIKLPELAKKIGRQGYMYTFTGKNYLKLLVCREAILKSGQPVFTGWIGNNELDFSINEDDGSPAGSIHFLLTNIRFRLS